MNWLTGSLRFLKRIAERIAGHGGPDAPEVPQTMVNIQTLRKITAHIGPEWLDGPQTTIAHTWHGIAQLIQDTPSGNVGAFNRASGIITDIANHITTVTTPDEMVPIPTDDLTFLASGVLEDAAERYENGFNNVFVLRPAESSLLSPEENAKKAKILRDFHSAVAHLTTSGNAAASHRAGMPRGTGLGC